MMSEGGLLSIFRSAYTPHYVFEAVGDQVQGFALRIFLEFNFFGLFGQMSGI